MTAMSLVSKAGKGRKKNPVYMYRFAQQTTLNAYLYYELYKSDPVVAVKNDFYLKNLYPSHGDDVGFFNFVEDGLYSDMIRKVACACLVHLLTLYTRVTQTLVLSIRLLE